MPYAREPRRIAFAPQLRTRRESNLNVFALLLSLIRVLLLIDILRGDHRFISRRGFFAFAIPITISAAVAATVPGLFIPAMLGLGVFGVTAVAAGLIAHRRAERRHISLVNAGAYIPDTAPPPYSATPSAQAPGHAPSSIPWSAVFPQTHGAVPPGVHRFRGGTYGSVTSPHPSATSAVTGDSSIRRGGYVPQDSSASNSGYAGYVPTDPSDPRDPTVLTFRRYAPPPAAYGFEDHTAAETTPSAPPADAPGYRSYSPF